MCSVWAPYRIDMSEFTFSACGVCELLSPFSVCGVCVSSFSVCGVCELLRPFSVCGVCELILSVWSVWDIEPILCVWSVWAHSQCVTCVSSFSVCGVCELILSVWSVCVSSFSVCVLSGPLFDLLFAQFKRGPGSMEHSRSYESFKILYTYQQKCWYKNDFFINRTQNTGRHGCKHYLTLYSTVYHGNYFLRQFRGYSGEKTILLDKLNRQR